MGILTVAICGGADARHLRWGRRSRAARTGVLLPTHSAMKLQNEWGTEHLHWLTGSRPSARKKAKGWGTERLWLVWRGAERESVESAE
jgi:hypothetical protein